MTICTEPYLVQLHVLHTQQNIELNSERRKKNERIKESPCSRTLHASYADTVATVAETVTVHAAQDVKTVKVKTDKKTGKRYGYDENNQKVTMTWGVTSSGFRYYFGKNGAVYQADKDTVGKYGILIKKIDKVYYGFDVSGHTVKGIRVEV